LDVEVRAEEVRALPTRARQRRADVALVISRRLRTAAPTRRADVVDAAPRDHP
jgi:hypothetical protein